MNITIISDGAWGTALALVAVSNDHRVTLWGPFPDYIEQMKQRRENIRFLPGRPLPGELTLTGNLTEAVADADIVILASPCQYMRQILSQLAAVPYPESAVYVNVAKGIEVGSLSRPQQIVKATLGSVSYASLSGPSHAEEVSRALPTAVVVSASELEVARKVQDTLMNDNLRIYTSDDVIGVELGGALKNVFAVAAGICDGMGFGDNSKAALITRGIVEMSRLGNVLGGKPETFAGLSGVGDLIATCISRHSRNRYVGEKLGQGRKLPDIQSDMGMAVAEGVKTAASAYQLARRHNVETPIIDEVHATLYSGKAPQEAARDLMTRSAKQEKVEIKA
ncbi:MAG: NAD(P)-dependent glycerol-3-phosphate dehydrogenase [Candidatus Pacebacteria bacterium]|nr:NAD(P)-dependent glycerol-3-phosphate dehydrogenase [Candidatus Paceibacterota bacterium]